MLNSTTAEKKRFDEMTPVIQKRECEVVALCMDDRGIPKSVEHSGPSGPGQLLYVLHQDI